MNEPTIIKEKRMSIKMATFFCLTALIAGFAFSEFWLKAEYDLKHFIDMSMGAISGGVSTAFWIWLHCDNTRK